jgi:hypothetical protein
LCAAFAHAAQAVRTLCRNLLTVCGSYRTLPGSTIERVEEPHYRYVDAVQDRVIGRA